MGAPSGKIERVWKAYAGGVGAGGGPQDHDLLRVGRAARITGSGGSRTLGRCSRAGSRVLLRPCLLAGPRGASPHARTRGGHLHGTRPDPRGGRRPIMTMGTLVWCARVSGSSPRARRTRPSCCMPMITRSASSTCLVIPSKGRAACSTITSYGPIASSPASRRISRFETQARLLGSRRGYRFQEGQRPLSRAREACDQPSARLAVIGPPT